MIEAPTNISSVDSPEGRYYLNSDTGEKLWSVTTVLGRYFKDPENNDGGLDAWKNKIGKEGADKILVQAGRRGGVLHSTIEKYLLGDPDYRKGVMPINLYTFNKFKKVLDENVTLVRALELPLFDSVYRSAIKSTVLDPTTIGTTKLERVARQKRNTSYPLSSQLLYCHRVLSVAGKLDCIAAYNGIDSLMDFKTSRRIKKQEHILPYFYQAETYADIANRQYGLNLKQTVIIIANDEEVFPQIFINPVGKYLEKISSIYADQRFNQAI